jgi:hypothetical protein
MASFAKFKSRAESSITLRADMNFIPRSLFLISALLIIQGFSSSPSKFFWIEPACDNCPGFMVAEVNSAINATLCADGSIASSCFISRIIDGKDEVNIRERGIVQGVMDFEHERAVMKIADGQIYKRLFYGDENGNRNLQNPQVYRLGISDFKPSYIRFRLNVPGDVALFEQFDAAKSDLKALSASKRLLSLNQYSKIEGALKSKDLLVVGHEQKAKTFEATEFFVKMS